MRYNLDYPAGSARTITHAVRNADQIRETEGDWSEGGFSCRH